MLDLQLPVLVYVNLHSFSKSLVAQFHTGSVIKIEKQQDIPTQTSFRYNYLM